MRLSPYLKLLLFITFVTLLSACNNDKTATSTPGEPGPVQEDPFNQINAALIEEGKITERSVSEIPEDAFTKEPFDEKDAKDQGEERPPEKIHPLLQEWIKTRAEDERERILINFQDDLKIRATKQELCVAFNICFTFLVYESLQISSVFSRVVSVLNA